jgi:hypothetical protein
MGSRKNYGLWRRNDMVKNHYRRSINQQYRLLSWRKINPARKKRSGMKGKRQWYGGEMAEGMCAVKPYGAQWPWKWNNNDASALEDGGAWSLAGRRTTITLLMPLCQPYDGNEAAWWLCRRNVVKPWLLAAILVSAWCGGDERYNDDCRVTECYDYSDDGIA